MAIADATIFVKHQNIQTRATYLDHSGEVQQSMIAVAVHAVQQVTLNVGGLETQQILKIVGESPKAVMATTPAQLQGGYTKTVSAHPPFGGPSLG